MKLIIAGSRSLSSAMYVDLIDFLIIDYGLKPTEIVSGCAKGIDTLGEIWALENSIPIKKFPADWDKYGKKAGYIRNNKMAKYATHCVVFWDGKSKGTEMMIKLAKENGLITQAVIYNSQVPYYL